MSGLHFMSGCDIDSIKSHKIPLKLGICQIFYTSKILKNQFNPRKRAYCDIFGQQLRMEDVLLYIISFRAIIYIQIHSSCFVETLAWIWQISQKG